MKLFRIKTTKGYYSQAGRYERVTGSKEIAALLCNTCAAEMMAFLVKHAPRISPEREEFKGHARCAGCATGTRERSDDGQTEA